MTRFSCALLATLLLAAFGWVGTQSAVAKPTSTFTIRGAGFGHGVGMSQWGAFGFAVHGFSAQDILKHYYTGTELGAIDPGRVVRVLLQSAGTVRFTGADKAGTRALNPATTYAVRRHGLLAVDLLSPRGRPIGTFTAPLQVAGPAGLVVLKGRAGNGIANGAYRGTLELRPGLFGGVNAINALPLEDYVKGVISLESPARWPLEALKAQAVAARTYAITTARGGDYDQLPDTRSQMYGGASAQTPATDQAAEETRGAVVTYQGQPVVTYFFSTSGGRTENIENTALGRDPKPWLQSVDDPYDTASPRHRWGPITMTLKQAQRKLRGLVKGKFRGIRVERRGVSPRVVSAQVIGSKGVTEVDGATLRGRFGLFDTWAFFTAISAGEAPPPGAPAQPTPTPDPQALDPAGGATARAARVGGTWPRPLGALTGSIVPAARGAAATVQVRRAGAWLEAGTASVGRGGRYVFPVRVAGTYRVLWHGTAGPAVSMG